LHWRHVGAVTVVLRKRGRNLGPTPPQILGTHLAALTPSHSVGIDPKRWSVELMHGELQSGLGLGEHQVRGDKDRSEHSIGMAVLASLLVLRVCHHEMVPF
jgi:hypothetical protein